MPQVILMQPLHRAGLGTTSVPHDTLQEVSQYKSDIKKLIFKRCNPEAVWRMV